MGVSAAVVALAANVALAELAWAAEVVSVAELVLAAEVDFRNEHLTPLAASVVMQAFHNIVGALELASSQTVGEQIVVVGRGICVILMGPLAQCPWALVVFEPSNASTFARNHRAENAHGQSAR